MKKFKKVFKVKEPPKYSHLTETNALRAGESAFKARISFYNNPYKDNPCKSAWIRGFKRAEKVYNEAIRKSLAIQESIGFEEVEVT